MLLVFVVFLFFVVAHCDQEWAKDFDEDLKKISENYVAELDSYVAEVQNMEIQNVTGSILMSNKLHILTQTTMGFLHQIKEQIYAFRGTLKGKYDFAREHFNAARFLLDTMRNPTRFDYEKNYVWAL